MLGSIQQHCAMLLLRARRCMGARALRALRLERFLLCHEHF